MFRGGLPPALLQEISWRSRIAGARERLRNNRVGGVFGSRGADMRHTFSMNEEQQRELLERIAEHQKRLMSRAGAKDDFASVEKRLVDLLETAKKRIVSEHGGQ
jgi:hypothetical protein